MIFMTLLKKILDSWAPSENPGLKVNETIEITDPKELILSGAAVAVLPDGTERSAYEMYGVLTNKDKTELNEFLAFKRAKQKNAQLEEKNAELQKEVKAVEEAVKAEQPVLEELPVPSAAGLKAKRLAAMAAGRAKAKAAREAALGK